MAIKVYTGTVSVDESAGAGTETLIKRIAALGSGFRQRISSIWLDCTNSTVGGTARIKIDLGAAGATQRTIADYDLAFIAGESINLLKDGPFEADTDIEVYVATAGGGAARDFYYRIPFDDSIEKVQSVFNGTGATDDVDLSMRSLGVANDTGDAVQFQSTNGRGLWLDGSDYGFYVTGVTAATRFSCAGEAAGNAFECIGGGTGHGGVFTGGATGRALSLAGGGTSGDAINISTTDGNGIVIQPSGIARIGLAINNCSGSAIYLRSTSTHAIDVGAGGNGNALHCVGAGTGSGGYFSSGAGATGNGITAVSQATVSGIGFYCLGAVTGEGLRVDGGATGNAAEFLAGGGNAHALYLAGQGGGAGFYSVGGATGNGVTLVAGGGNAHGMSATGAGTGHGFTMVKGGGAGSKDIDADEISSIVSSVALMPTTTGLEGAFKMIGGQHKPSYKDLTYIV